MNEKAVPTEVSLDQLIALCDEMRALSRTGVPMERSMLNLAEELPSELGKVAAHIGERGESGESLEQIVSSDELKLPPVFKAVITAGIRSGQLSAALEGMATTGRRIAELRRSIIQAALYPLAVLVFVSGLCLFVLNRLSVVYADAVAHHGVDQLRTGMDLLAFLSRWAWLVAAIVVVSFFFWWVISARATSVQPGSLSNGLFCLPWTRKLLRLGRLSTFTDVLALLIQQEVPLPESLVLAGEASGDVALRREANQLAESLERGEAIETDPEQRHAIPTLLRWQVMAQKSTPQLVESLRASAKSHQRRATQLAEWLHLQLPVILTVGVGGVATLLYAFAVMGPWYTLLTNLAMQNMPS